MGDMRWVCWGVVVLLLGGCGVQAQDEPHAVDLPRHALTTPSLGPMDPAGEVAQVLCLARGDRLAQVVRRTAAYPTVQAQLTSLVAGPTTAERGEGLTTVLSGFALTARIRPGGEVTVEIPEVDEGYARSDEILAYGQIVCTLTARADVGSVLFTRDGQRLEVPRADFTLSGSPLTSGDYSSLLGPG